jgi:hypothetical protein
VFSLGTRRAFRPPGGPPQPRCRRRPSRFPREWSPRHEMIAHPWPHLRQAQRRGVALCVYGTIRAQRACQPAVLTAPWAVGRGRACASDGAQGPRIGRTARPPASPSWRSACAVRRGWVGAWPGGRARSWRWSWRRPPLGTVWWGWPSACATAAVRSQGPGTCGRPTRRAPGCPTSGACCGGGARRGPGVCGWWSWLTGGDGVPACGHGCGTGTGIRWCTCRRP